MNVRFDNTTARPKRSTILEQLRGHIVEGRMLRGAKLPKRTELAASFDASSVTVQRALDELIADGFVHARRGQGTFVADHPPHLATYALVTPGMHHGRPRSLYYEAIERVAGVVETQGPHRLPIFRYGDLTHRDPEFHRLVGAIHRRALAGIIFAAHPFDFIDTPVLDAPGLPRIGVMVGPGMPGVSAIEFGTDEWMDMAGDFLASRGRKRVGWIAGAAVDPGQMHRMANRVRAYGLDIPGALIQGIAPDFTFWAASAAQLMMRIPPGERPDAIIISDDNLVEPATAGLRAAGVRVLCTHEAPDLSSGKRKVSGGGEAPGGVLVVAHANLPHPPKAMVPVTFLGYDMRRLLSLCMKAIDHQRAGKPWDRILAVDPCFQDPRL